MDKRGIVISIILLLAIGIFSNYYGFNEITGRGIGDKIQEAWAFVFDAGHVYNKADSTIKILDEDGKSDEVKPKGDSDCDHIKTGAKSDKKIIKVKIPDGCEANVYNSKEFKGKLKAVVTGTGGCMNNHFRKKMIEACDGTKITNPEDYGIYIFDKGTHVDVHFSNYVNIYVSPDQGTSQNTNPTEKY